MVQGAFKNLRLSDFVMSCEKDVCDLFIQTFTDSESEEEGQVLGALVTELINTTPTVNYFGFLARIEGILVGSIFFTRLGIEGHEDAWLLSPVAVKPGYQSRGVGAELIQFGLSVASKRGIDVVFTYGDPSYYGKFGFNFISEDAVKAPHTLSYPSGWLMRVSSDRRVVYIGTQAQCVKAFDQSKYW